LLLYGCSGKSTEIRDQREAAEKAHKELERSFEDDGAELEEPTTEERAEEQGNLDSSDGPAPSWISSPPRNTSKHVYGVGSSPLRGDPTSSLNKAQDQARVELIERLEVKVSSTTTTRSKKVTENSKSQITRSVMSQVRTEVPEAELSHLEIEDTYLDRERGTAYALVRLDREAAIKELVRRLQGIEKRLNKLEATPRQEDRLKELQSLLPALALLEERKSILKKLQRLSRDQPEQTSSSVVSDLRSRVSKLLDSLRVVLVPEDGAARPELASRLRTDLSRLGLHVRERGEGDLILRYSLSLRSRQQEGVHFAFTRGRITVLTEDEKVLNDFQARAKGGSQDESLARDRAISHLAQKMGEKLGESLLESLQESRIL